MPDTRLEAAAGRPNLCGLKQPRDPAPRAVNLQWQLLSNQAAQTCSGGVRPALQIAAAVLNRVSEKAGISRAHSESPPFLYGETKISLGETPGQRPLIQRLPEVKPFILPPPSS